MPTLNRYSDDSQKKGFYVRTYVGGQTPITLQVTPMAARIFNAVGYRDGDAIPSKLVWAMYNLDMLYTLSSFDPDNTPDNIEPSVVLREFDIDSELEEKERQMLISYLEEYSGPDKERIEKLRDELIDGISESVLEKDVDEWGPEWKQPPSSPDEIKTLFKSWVPSELSQRAEKALLLCEAFVQWSVRTFHTHDRLTDRPIVEIGNKEIVYEIDPTVNTKEVLIADARGNIESVSDRYSSYIYDYRIERILSDGTKETAFVKDEIIVSYESYGEGGSITLLKYDLDEIIPPRESQVLSSGTDQPSAELLTDEYLSIPIESLEEVIQKDHPKNLVENEESETSAPVPDEVSKTIQSLSGYKIFKIDDISNAGNPKIELDETLVVVLGMQGVERGDYIVTKWEGHAQSGHTHIERAVFLENVPSEGTEEWLREHL